MPLPVYAYVPQGQPDRQPQRRVVLARPEPPEMPSLPKASQRHFVLMVACPIQLCAVYNDLHRREYIQNLSYLLPEPAWSLPTQLSVHLVGLGSSMSASW